MSYNIKNPSALVDAVISLDTYLAEISRLGAKIESLNFNLDADCEQAERLLTRFAECGESVAAEVARLSSALTAARAQADLASQTVAIRAEELKARKGDAGLLMDQFRSLGEKVRDLTVSLQDFKPLEGEEPSLEERHQMTMKLASLDALLQPLIQEARDLKTRAHAAKMKLVEQGSDAIAQSLGALARRLSTFKSAELDPISEAQP